MARDAHRMVLRPQLLTFAVLEQLEQRGLIMLPRPSRMLAGAPHADAVESLYESQPEQGGHKLICVRKNETAIRLTHHTDHEDVIFVNLALQHTFKPLYLVVAMHPVAVFAERIKTGTLVSSDVCAFEVNYREPRTNFFTILKDTPHCEVTIPGDGEAPVFYVTEPTAMKMHYIETSPYQLCLSL